MLIFGVLVDIARTIIKKPQTNFLIGIQPFSAFTESKRVELVIEASEGTEA